jgi:type VI protein secretion system component VasA
MEEGRGGPPPPLAWRLLWPSGVRARGVPSPAELVLVDPGFRPAPPAEEALEVTALWTQGPWPCRLGEGVRLEVLDRGEGARLLEPCTPSVPRAPEGAWRILEPLIKDQMDLAFQGPRGLQEALRAHNRGGAEAFEGMIQALEGIRARVTTACMREPGAAVFSRGVELTLVFHGERCPGACLPLFVRLLVPFLAASCDEGTFLRFRALTDGGDLLHEALAPGSRPAF